MTTGNPSLEGMALRSKVLAELDTRVADFAREIGVVCQNCVLSDGVIVRAQYIRPGCEGPVDPQEPGYPMTDYTGQRCPVFQHPTTGVIDYA